MTITDEHLASVMRHAETALADIATLARQSANAPLSAARQSMHHERMAFLDEFLRILDAYARQLQNAIDDRIGIPFDDPRSKTVLPELVDFRERLGDIERLRRRIAYTLTPEPTGAGHPPKEQK
jgi:hypothetical protein